MKVIKNNYTPEYPKQIICPNCSSVLEYEEIDVVIKKHDPDHSTYMIGVPMLHCLCCHKDFRID